jgi:hypothetical protein
MTDLQKEQLCKKLPDWAIKDHPTKKGMSVIHPMAVIERLNEVFGIGTWHFKAEYISCDKEVQEVSVYKDGKKTDAKKDRVIYMSAVKGILEIPEHSIHLEQFGGSTNDDKGDALKGGATDALTKIASYLNIGAEIYKGKGNIDGDQKEETPREKAERLIAEAKTIPDLQALINGVGQSKNLTTKDKEELNFIINEKLEGLDPTK